MAHKSNHANLVTDADNKYFIIDPITRTIKNETKKITLIKNDHHSERFTFEVPSEIEGHNMTMCNHVEIHFINIDGQTRDKSTGIYLVEDFALSPSDPTKMTFSWLISNAATAHAGTLSFSIRFACINDSSATVLYSWNTTIYAGIIISDSMYNSNVVVEPYDDVLANWLNKFEEAYNELETMYKQRFDEIEKQMLAKEPLGIESTETSSVRTTDTKTYTTVTVTKTDGTTSSFTVEAQNGKDGQDGKDGKDGLDADGIIGMELIDGILYAKTNESNSLEFALNDTGELTIEF